MAEKYNLSREQLFVKQEAIAKNIALFFDLLWIKVNAIVCSPTARVTFHTIILILGIGGWRPLVVINLKYKQVELGIMRDLTNKSRKKLVTNITLYQNKQLFSAIYTR